MLPRLLFQIKRRSGPVVPNTGPDFYVFVGKLLISLVTELLSSSERFKVKISRYFVSIKKYTHDNDNRSQNQTFIYP